MDLSELGPFFAVRRSADGPGWRPLRDLFDTGVLSERGGRVGEALAAQHGAPVPSRVAGSIMSLGLFSRLLSPQVGAAMVGAGLPRLDPDRTWWQPASPGSSMLSLALTGDPEPVQLNGEVEVVLQLAGRVSEAFSLSALVTRGNVASAVFGAVSMVLRTRADLAPQIPESTSNLLRGPLAGTGAFTGPGTGVGRGFRRRSCCLYYRVPGGGYCGDCVLWR